MEVGVGPNEGCSAKGKKKLNSLFLFLLSTSEISMCEERRKKHRRMHINKRQNMETCTIQI
jgi:hypothetical protein